METNKKLIHKYNSKATTIIVSRTNKGFKLSVTSPKFWIHGKPITKIQFYYEIDVIGEKAYWV